MLIVADENIPSAREAFGTLGELRLMPGRAMTSESVAPADALVVRSVTGVGQGLLEGSRVRFVGTATIGADHIDQAWLASRGIAFASAPGSNAESVAQWVTAALCALAGRVGGLRGKTIGVVGAGHCGTRVTRVAAAFGMTPILCDPPLARATGEARYRPLAELAACDVLTLHVPLLREGPDRTVGMIDAAYLASMRPGAILLHACRGGVVDETAVLEALARGWIAAVALDVWEGEPAIRADTLRAAAIATPHIAGYSLDGKLRGAEMIHEALCRHWSLEPSWSARGGLPETIDTVMVQAPEDGDDEAVIARLVERAYSILRDDALLRATAELSPAERAAEFDAQRKRYPERREFSATRVELDPPCPDLARRLAGLGFQIG